MCKEDDMHQISYAHIAQCSMFHTAIVLFYPVASF